MSEDPTRIVCFCHNVRLNVLLEAIRAGAITLEEIKLKTEASTGCGGCEWDVTSVLEEELKSAPSSATG